MKNTKLSVILGLLLAFMLSMSFANAVQTFTVDPTEITDSVNVGSSSSTTLTLTNTGDEIFDVSVSTTAATSGSDSITLTPSVSTLSAIAVSGTSNVAISYNPSGVPAGTYTGEVTLTTQDSTQSTNVPVTITVTASAGPELSFINQPDNRLEMAGELDRTERQTFVLVNSGNITLTDIEFDFEDLEGDEDEIKAGDIEIGNNDDDGFELEPGEENSIRFSVDVSSGLEVETYRGDFRLTTAEGFDFDFELEFEITGGDLEVEFKGTQISNEVLKIEGEAGERLTNIEFDIDNIGDVDAFGLVLEVDDDLDEEFSSDTFDKNQITFSPTSIDLESDEEDTIDMDISIPEDTPDGTYFGELRLLDSEGDELDEITLELRVVGDVFIKELKGADQEYNPGDNVDIEVVVRNQGSQVQRGVQVTGTLFDVDFGNSDITEASNTFLLDINRERTEILRFNLPDDVDDGSHTLEITVDFDDGEITELVDIIIRRADKNFVIDSFGINPSVVRCDPSIFTFTKVENLGRFDENVKVKVEIVGEGIADETSLFELEVDEDFQHNSNLDISRLEAGTYEVAHTVEYNGGFEKRESTLRINECSDTAGGIDIEPIEETNVTVNSINDSNEDSFTIGGEEVSKNTVYLGGAVLLVFVLIIISLFFL